MQTATIHRLNQLNRDFYQQVAVSFDETRQQPWLGWSNLTPFLQTITNVTISSTIIDVGCGNGRFAEFVNQNAPADWQYFGFDQNEELLTSARNRLTKLAWQNNLTQLDLVTTLLNQSIPQLP